MNQIVKAEIIVILPLLGSIAMSVVNGGLARMFNIYFLALIMQALYFNVKMMSGFGGITGLLFIVLYMIKPTFLLESGLGFGDFIPRMGAYLCAVVVLTLLTKWGQETLRDATEEGKKSHEAFEQLQVVFDKINQTSLQVDNNAMRASTRMNQCLNSSVEINQSVTELSKRIDFTSDNLKSARESVENSGQHVKDTFELMNTIESLFTNVNKEVDDSGNAVSHMRIQMESLQYRAKPIFWHLMRPLKQQGQVSMEKVLLLLHKKLESFQKRVVSLRKASVPLPLNLSTRRKPL